MPLATTDKKAIERNVMREVRYCAIGVHHADSKERIITHLYEVKSVRLVKRCDISAGQSGKAEPANDAEYWLFELGYARPLEQPIQMPVRTFKFRLTDAAALLVAKGYIPIQRGL